MESKLGTGTEVMDWLLEGGYEKDVVTTIYGPPGSGKTNLCMLCIAHAVKNKKVIYIDTEGSFSVSRFKQISEEYKDILKRIIFLRPLNFEEQKKSFETLKGIVNDSIGLIVLDSIAMLYRLELGKSKNLYAINRDLGLQLSYLTEIARKEKIPVLVTNQVYPDFEKDGEIKMVGGDLLKYQSKCLIELQVINGKRKAILRKHRSLPDQKEIMFRITEKGIRELSQQ